MIEEIHEGSFGTHANGHAMARKILRADYYWLTMERDCCAHVRKCHKCQSPCELRLLQLSLLLHLPFTEQDPPPSPSRFVPHQLFASIPTAPSLLLALPLPLSLPVINICIINHFYYSLNSFISRFYFLFFPSHFAISNFRYSPAASTTELDAVSSFSEIVPDTVVFDDFEK